MKQIKFKVGDRLEALDYQKEEYGCDYVTITSINLKNKVYHWRAEWKLMEMNVCSGYFFHEAKEYKD